MEKTASQMFDRVLNIHQLKAFFNLFSLAIFSHFLSTTLNGYCKNTIVVSFHRDTPYNNF